jgi:8-oxo-(d)GTP phosphatase
MRNARATSAGGVVLRDGPDGPEVVVVHRRSPRLWALPKGTPVVGESLEETALRETREETGLEVAITEPLASINYVFVHSGTRFHKTVHFYRMRATGGSLEAHDHEFDEVLWVGGSEALTLLNYPTERGVLEQALSLPLGSAR